MLPLLSENIDSTEFDHSSIEKQMNYNPQIESSSCPRPQMAWQIYEQLLRIANNNQQKQSSTTTYEQIDIKRMWLAAFTGPRLSYRLGVAAGVAEPL